MVTTAPYGTWASPISAADTVVGVVGFAEVAEDDGVLYWVEMRPSEGGRQVLVRRTVDGTIEDMTPQPISVRTRVHEYGVVPSLSVTGASCSATSRNSASMRSGTARSQR